MTRFTITKAELEALVEAHKPGWVAKALARTAALPQVPKSKDFANIWSEIKEVFIRLQGSKCAYCEKWLEAENIEHDVEHFRPKSKVSRWKVPKALVDAGVTVAQPAIGSEPGYRLLAYQMMNYATSCKTCNSILKGDRFPIRGKRNSSGADPSNLKSEKAYLIYPIGDLDDDPETLIEFRGVVPRPKPARGVKRLRAMVTVAFFGLDDWRKRKALLLDRAEWIEKLYWALELKGSGGDPADVAAATQAVDRMTSTRFRHANCLRCYRRLHEGDRAKAREMYASIKDLLTSYNL